MKYRNVCCFIEIYIEWINTLWGKYNQVLEYNPCMLVNKVYFVKIPTNKLNK